DDDGEAEVRNDEGEEGAERFEAEPDGSGVDEDHREDADEDVAGASAADDHEGFVDEDGDEQDVGHTGQGERRQTGDESVEARHVWAQRTILTCGGRKDYGPQINADE